MELKYAVFLINLQRDKSFMVNPCLLPTPAGLERYIHAVWMMRGPVSGTESLITMADGSPGLIFQHPSAGLMKVHDKPLAPLYIYGQASKSSRLTITGSLDAIGICFKPSAVPKIFGLRADEITDSCIGIRELKGSGNQEIEMKLIEASSMDERLLLITKYLQHTLCSRSYRADQTTDQAINHIFKTSGNISLHDLRRNLYVSERSLERKFREQVGISASLYARICRFQESMRQLKEEKFQKLSDIAYLNGYADQSHFIRSFKSFAGCSPNQYKNRSVKLIDSFAFDPLKAE